MEIEEEPMAKVLVVDDSTVMVNEIHSFLKENGIEPLIASNGLEGFERLRDTGDISLALVDINMRKLDGLSMIAKVRDEIPECKTQFIMMTTEFDRKFKERGRSLGVIGWIIKPFNKEMALATIKKILGHG